MGQRTERTFDEHGNTVEEVVTDPPAEAEAGAEGASAAPEGVPDNQAEDGAAPPPKFRIGDREFATQDEALAYAQSQVSALTTEQAIADAYSRGMRDAAVAVAPPNPVVTPPPKPKFNAEELYTNPQEFLEKYGRQIKEEARAELTQAQSIREQSDAIWREFTDRHPSLADFRTETEHFVESEQKQVQAIIATKGRPAAYDYIATKLKTRFEKYGNAVKPQRALPNAGAGSSPNGATATVTTKPPPKKPLSFADQIRSIRRGRA